MGQTKLSCGMGLMVPAVLLAGLLVLGCDSTPNDGDGDGDGYSLVVVLEKNLDLTQDFLHVRFRKDNIGIPGALVVVDGDTIDVPSASGRTTQIYTPPRWQHGEKIQIFVSDTAGDMVYRDSVTIPFGFDVDNVVPATHLWRPVDGNASVTWTASIGSSGYAVSVRPRSTGSSAVGLREYYESQSGLTHIIPPGTFYTQLGALVEDVYDIEVIAYTPNFVARDNPPYKIPPADDVPVPISKTGITGAISALVVCPRDTMLVQTQ